MHLISLEYDPPVIEAGFGGRIDLMEMRLIAEDLESYFLSYRNAGFYLVLDYSKAHPFPTEVLDALEEIKSSAGAKGVRRIFTVPHEDEVAVEATSENEEIVPYPKSIMFRRLQEKRAA